MTEAEIGIRHFEEGGMSQKPRNIATRRRPRQINGFSPQSIHRKPVLSKLWI